MGQGRDFCESGAQRPPPQGANKKRDPVPHFENENCDLEIIFEESPGERWAKPTDERSVHERSESPILGFPS